MNGITCALSCIFNVEILLCSAHFLSHNALVVVLLSVACAHRFVQERTVVRARAFRRRFPTVAFSEIATTHFARARADVIQTRIYRRD